MRSITGQLRLLLCLFLGFWAIGALAEPKDFELPGLDGKTYKLSDYRGKWVLVNYWATWCPPCLEELPELEVFHNSHKDKDAVVLGVDMERIKEEKLRKFVDEQFLSYPILMSQPAMKTELGEVPGLPTSFLIDPSGKVVAKQVGSLTAADIEQFIEGHNQVKEN